MRQTRDLSSATGPVRLGQTDWNKPMDHFEYRDGVLHAEDVNLVGLAETIGTPFYCYSTATLRHH